MKCEMEKWKKPLLSKGGEQMKGTREDKANFY